MTTNNRRTRISSKHERRHQSNPVGPAMWRLAEPQRAHLPNRHQPQPQLLNSCVAAAPNPSPAAPSRSTPNSRKGARWLRRDGHTSSTRPCPLHQLGCTEAVSDLARPRGDLRSELHRHRRQDPRTGRQGERLDDGGERAKHCLVPPGHGRPGDPVARQDASRYPVLGWHPRTDRQLKQGCGLQR